VSFKEFLKNTYQVFLFVIGIIIISVILKNFFNIPFFSYIYDIIKNNIVVFYSLLFIILKFIFKIENTTTVFIINMIFLLLILPFFPELLAPFFNKVSTVIPKYQVVHLLYNFVIIYITVIVVSATVHFSKTSKYYEFNWFYKIILAISIYLQLIAFLASNLNFRT